MTTRTPRFIWLQTGDDEESQPYSDGVTWSEDQVNDSDTKYIRAAPAEPDRAADPRLVREFRDADAQTPMTDAVRDACRPWEYCQGEPPEWGSPLMNVWQAAIIWCQELVATAYEIKSYESDGASESFDEDALVGFTSIISQVAEKAEQERDALAKDAERYRWIRLAGVDVTISNRFVSICESEPQTPELFDAAIDAAISGRDAT